MSGVINTRSKLQ